MSSRFWILGWLLVLAPAMTACAKARAAAVPEGPPLQMPAPPQRVVAPVEEPPPVAVLPEPEPPPEVEPPRPARPTAEEKPAPPAAAPPRPAAATPPPSPRDLRPASPANSGSSERNIRDLLARASRDINQVDYGRLSVEGRSQYEQSKRFSIQAEQALRERNLIFAATLADKAATLAAELLGR